MGALPKARAVFVRGSAAARAAAPSRALLGAREQPESDGRSGGRGQRNNGTAGSRRHF
jgi:hypothetical protein